MIRLQATSGQSLIETVMAIFILTTGLASGLALAIFSFGASSDITEKIAATGLAREGIEAVRRVRDSNWLNGTLSDCGGGQFCYANWLSNPTSIQGEDPPSGLEYRIVFDPTSPGSKWTPILSGPYDNYRLYYQAGGELAHDATLNPSNFFRKIIIINQSESPPYDATSPLVLVKSVVWWWGKNCPPISYYTGPSSTQCKIITEEYLTNWRNY